MLEEKPKSSSDLTSGCVFHFCSLTHSTAEKRAFGCRAGRCTDSLWVDVGLMSSKQKCSYCILCRLGRVALPRLLRLVGECLCHGLCHTLNMLVVSFLLSSTSSSVWDKAQVEVVLDSKLKNVRDKVKAAGSTHVRLAALDYSECFISHFPTFLLENGNNSRRVPLVKYCSKVLNDSDLNSFILHVCPGCFSAEAAEAI